MKTLEINLAGGGDNAIDPRVAPSGTISRAVNLRLDRQGRLVPRNGYTSLGVTVQGSATGLVPFDLHDMDGTLVCLGNNSLANQSGIRRPFRFMGNPTQGVWRSEHPSGSSGVSLGTDARDTALPRADNIEVMLSETNPIETNSCVADCAVSDDGGVVLIASLDNNGITTLTQLTALDCGTGLIIYAERLTGANARILALPTGGRDFRIFTQASGSTTIKVGNLNLAAATPTVTGTVNVTTACSAYPCAYDVSNFVGTTDFLIAFATATGYSWLRINSATVVQTGPTAVADLANAPVTICGATGQAVSVANVRAVSGVNLRTFTTAAALSLGPTNIDYNGPNIVTWVGMAMLGTSSVFCRFQSETNGSDGIYAVNATQAAHVLVNNTRHFGCRAWTKPLMVSNQPLAIQTLARRSAPCIYGIVTSQTDQTSDLFDLLHGTLFDGLAVGTYAPETVAFISSLSARAGTREIYGALVTLDPRDKTYRANLIRFEWDSGKRRQGVTASGSLYLTGGNMMQFDGRSVGELGVEIVPTVNDLTSATVGGGALTALGVYTTQVVYRYVTATGEFVQSSPSNPATRTLTGADNTLLYNVLTPYGLRIRANNGAQVFMDIYRTEAGGSIPRLVKSIALNSSFAFGFYSSVSDGVADSVQQTGAPLYTQGADGSVSGRLPLAIADPGRFIAARGGRLLVGSLERPNSLQLSVEKRPGETMGFVNDDLFFIDNPEALTGVAVAADSRTYLFGGSTVRELVGEGPNAAGADATLIEPVLVEPSIGCVDWRSIAVTQMGLFFQSSRLPDPKLYIIPLGGGQAMIASEGIRDTLRDYPVITSATVLEQEQLLTFTLQNTTGTDGRVVHLDLTNSGIGQRGFVGRWFVDRLPQLEGSPKIEIVQESYFVFPTQASGTVVVVPLPAGKRVGDRVHIYISISSGASAVVPAGLSGYTLVASVLAGGANQLATTLYEQIVSTVNQQLAATISVTSGTSAAFSAIVRVSLLRGGHATQPAEAVTQTSGVGGATSLALPTLTPSWGSARNYWSTHVMGNTAFTTQALSIWRSPPSGFERFAEQFKSAVNAQTASNGTRILEAASLAGVIWGTPFSNTCMAILAAVRPLAAAGTPARASVQFGGRLVVCSNTDVLRNDSAAIADIGAAFIGTELELADLYPMGPGGAGRHHSLVFVGELLGFCQLNCALSYDEGRNWTLLQPFLLSVTNGYSVGQTLRLLWVPKRRKINGVRARFSVSEDTIDSPLAGDTPGVAMQRAYFQFDELIGPSRVQPSQRK